MQPRSILFTLYILQYIFFTHGQKVQTMAPQQACVPSSVTLRCPANYVVVVTNAEYGVAQLDGSCSYSPGDCVADAMNIAICTTDNIQCLVYAARRKLPQCNDQFSSYVRVEYDCVPISMNDSSKEYSVCQNGLDITSDQGILKSPGYPSQFQTTTAECFRAIHVPADKVIRLWLSDLYISGVGTNCANDHVYVVDSVQTYRYCGLKRYAYPYLCSSTIIIQYFVKTQLSIYRGMRMYFEIVDRSPNDNCPNPNGTVTAIQSTTPIITTADPSIITTVPVYSTLGIASPVLSFQICKGESYTLQCPSNYVIAVRTNIYGVTQSDQCEPHDTSKHCVVTTESPFSCRQTCTYLYTGNRVVPSCSNRNANYQYVEYQCIPTNTVLVSPDIPCPTDGSKVPIQINRNGRFQSYSYPKLEKMNCTYRFKTTPGDIMNFYALDISLNDYSPNCSSNKITFIEDGELQGSDYCEQRSYSLVYSSCSNEFDLRYIVNDDSLLFSEGVELYIENQVRPSDWSCGQPLPTLSSPPTIPTTPFITPTAVPLTNETFMVARDEMEHDICYGSSLVQTCPTGYTFMVIGAFYGVKKQASNKCGFVQGDCVHETLSTITQCRNDVPNCYITYSTNKRRLAQCSDNYADYLHITSQCIPSRPVGSTVTIQTYDICDTNNPVADLNGIISSPGFPRYQQTNNECRRSLTGIQDRVLKIWINEMAVSSGGRRSLDDDSNEPDLVIYKNDDTDYFDDLEQTYPSIRDICINDYLIINAPHVAYVYCGTRKLAMRPICAASVTIQYKSTSAPNLFYKGFKFYFEWVEKPVEILCGGDLGLSTTTPINEPIPDWALNLELSPILSAQICLGTSQTLRCPRGSDYVLSIIESSYGVTGTGLCEVPSPSHCQQAASLGLTCTQSCFIEYDIPTPLIQCGSQNADYISIQYECIPTRLPNGANPIDICASATTDTIAMNSGMMISPRYPTLGAARTCTKKIETLPNKLWMVFIVDLFLEGANDFGDCNAASLTIFDGNVNIVRCGLQQPELISISCSNIVEFKFVSTHQALGYRGFKLFFQTIDVPSNWACKPTGFTTPPPTITTPRLPTTTSLLPPSSQIAAYGGTTNGTRQYCKLPFTYQGNSQASCLRTDPPSSTPGQDIKEPWCSLTSNFDTDRQWGFCELGVTDSTLTDICRSQSQVLKCPSGYVIDIITADYAAKPDGNIGTGACIYDKNDCFQTDTLTIQTLCAGKSSCTAYHFVKTLASCQNRPTAYLHIDYNCLPNDIPAITTYNLCDSSLLPQTDTRRGFIISPNFPNTQNNFDCTFNLQTVKPNQDIYLYIVDMDLNSANLLGQGCTKDRLRITADNNIREICGRSYTNFLINTCHASVSLQLIRSSDAIGRGVKLYFEFRERSPAEICPVLITTSVRPPTIPTSSRPTTEPSRPNYFPEPSPRQIKTLCYPDISSLFGTNNFQCPQDYIIVIHRAFYGKGARCTYTAGDCQTEADAVYRTCSGKQACSVSFLNIVTLPECNQAIANYLFVEYQCLPTPSIVASNVDLCTGQIGQFTGTSGILKSSSYPSYTPTQCANVTLGTDDANLVIYIYLLDLNIGAPDPNTGNCTNDYLLLSYQCNNQLYSERLCGTRPTELLFSTCSPTDKIFASYNLLSLNPQSERGFALLYHLLPQSTLTTAIATTLRTTTVTVSTTPQITTPVIVPTTPQRTTAVIVPTTPQRTTAVIVPTTPQRTTTVTVPTTTPSGQGPISTFTYLSTTCVLQAITVRCEIPGYVLVIHKVQLGVSKTGTCAYSGNDCFEDRTNLYNLCAGKTTCYIFPPSMPIASCNNSRSNYLYVEHQCIPTRPKLNIDICSPTSSLQRVEGGAIVSSLNYTSAYQDCKVELQANTLLGTQVHKGLKIYILTLNLPTGTAPREQGAQCSPTDPSIEITDLESGVTRLCRNSHTRYLLETCSNTVEIRYQNSVMSLGSTRFKGFEIYLESVENEKCRPTSTLPTPTLPYVIAKGTACGRSNGRERADFSCTPDYGLVFLQSYQFVTKQPDQCDVTENTCFYSSEQPKAQCAGQQTCSYIHTAPPQNLCGNIQPDSTEFYYQCLPMRPTGQLRKYQLCTDRITTTNMGFIETSGYPLSYQNGRQQCSLIIIIPAFTDKKLSVYLYIIELSLLDTLAINPSSSQGECYDSITYSYGNTTGSLCGKIDQPALEFHSNNKDVNLTVNISSTLPLSQMNDWQGARLFFIIDEQSLPSPPGSLVPTTPQITTATATTTKDPTETEPTATPSPSNHGGVIAGVVICVLVVLGGLVGFVLYRRRLSLKYGNSPTVRYDTHMITVDAPQTNGKTLKRTTSIPANSLKGPSAFVSPFFTKPEANGKEEIDAAPDA